jgi:hypothetical protein
MASGMKSQALVVCALTVLSGHVVAFQNEPAGFRGIKWGEGFSVHGTEMTLLRQVKGGATWYTRKAQKMFFGDARLSQLIYGYKSDRFLIVHMETSGVRNRIALTKEFLSRFGEPDERKNNFFHKGESDYYYRWGPEVFSEKGKGADTRVILSCGNERPAPGTEDDCQAEILSKKVIEVIAVEIKKEEEEKARAHGPACPTATKLKVESKGRYSEVIEANSFGPRSFGWIFNDTQGWSIFRDTKYDNDYFANRAGFLAVRKSTIRKTLVNGDRLSMVAPYFGKIDKPTWHKDQYGRPILVERYEAIYPKGCELLAKETKREEANTTSEKRKAEFQAQGNTAERIECRDDDRKLRVGMTLDRVKQCWPHFGLFRLTGEINRADGIVSIYEMPMDDKGSLAYAIGVGTIYVMGGEVIAWTR